MSGDCDHQWIAMYGQPDCSCYSYWYAVCILCGEEGPEEDTEEEALDAAMV